MTSSSISACAYIRRTKSSVPQARSASRARQIHVIRVATERPPVRLHRSRLREEPDEPGDPIRVRRGKQGGNHAPIGGRQQGRTTLTRRVEDREKVGRPRLQVRETAHVIREARPSPVVEAQPREGCQLQPRPRGGLKVEEQLDVGRDGADHGDLVLARGIAEQLLPM